MKAFRQKRLGQEHLRVAQAEIARLRREVETLDRSHLELRARLAASERAQQLAEDEVGRLRAAAAQSQQDRWLEWAFANGQWRGGGRQPGSRDDGHEGTPDARLV